MCIRKYRILSILTILSTVHITHAGPAVTLDSGIYDLSQLTVGDQIEIDVRLAGLVPAQTLEFLAVTVDYDSDIYAADIVSAGPTVPNAEGFLGNVGPGYIDGSFDTLDTTVASLITTNGNFFTIRLDAIDVGTGTFRINFSDGIGENGLGGPLSGVTAGIALPYAVVSATNDGDLDRDGFVGISDLNIILGNWNQTIFLGNPSKVGDVTGDYFVGIDDLNAVLGNWNQSVTPGDFLAGDINGDGFVGIDDLGTILGNWNLNLPTTDPRADSNVDGFVGIDDLNVVLGNWNVGSPPSLEMSVLVPEPSTTVTLTLFTFTWLRQRMR